MPKVRKLLASGLIAVIGAIILAIVTIIIVTEIKYSAGFERPDIN